MRFHNITNADMLNGVGLRVVLWVSGCSHGCKGCHNPITWNANDGLEFNNEAKEEIFAELEHSYTSGITLSGGDPLNCANLSTINELIDEIREKYPTKTIWIYSGYVYENLVSSTSEEDKLRLEIVEKCDVFCDGPFVEAEKNANKHWVGSNNQKVIVMLPKNIDIKNTSIEDLRNQYAIDDQCYLCDTKTHTIVF